MQDIDPGTLPTIRRVEMAAFAWFLRQDDIDAICVERPGAHPGDPLPTLRVLLGKDGMHVSRGYSLSQLGRCRFQDDVQFLIEHELDEAVSQWRRNAGSFDRRPG